MISSEKVKSSPTLAEVFEKLRREGREEGREVGREEGALLERRNLAIELIREKFADEKIARLTKLTIKEVQEIRESL